MMSQVDTTTVRRHLERFDYGVRRERIRTARDVAPGILVDVLVAEADDVGVPRWFPPDAHVGDLPRWETAIGRCGLAEFLQIGSGRDRNGPGSLRAGTVPQCKKPDRQQGAREERE